MRKTLAAQRDKMYQESRKSFTFISQIIMLKLIYNHHDELNDECTFNEGTKNLFQYIFCGMISFELLLQFSSCAFHFDF